MESVGEVDGVLIVRAGDKAISAGELSKIDISSSEFNDNNIGIAVKDKSNVYLSNVKFTENETAVSIYAKNWRFGGPGRASVSNGFFKDNKLDVETTEGAQLKLDKNTKIFTEIGEGSVLYAK